MVNNGRRGSHDLSRGNRIVINHQEVRSSCGLGKNNGTGVGCLTAFTGGWGMIAVDAFSPLRYHCIHGYFSHVVCPVQIGGRCYRATGAPGSPLGPSQIGHVISVSNLTQARREAVTSLFPPIIHVVTLTVGEQTASRWTPRSSRIIKV